MKAQVIIKQAPIEDSPLEYRDVEDPVPGPNDVRIKVEACAVCHTDRHIMEGDLPFVKSPIIPGHQVVGLIDEVGKGVTGMKLGDRIGIPWLSKSCGICEYCKKGLENLCSAGEFTGYHKDGGYAEYALCKSDFAIKLPHRLDPKTIAPLLCAGLVGFRAYKLSGIRPGETLGLFGFGSSADLILQVARQFNCNVAVFTRSKEHQKKALQLGATWAGTADMDPGLLLDQAIMFTPNGELIPKALRWLKRGGNIVINAIHMSPIPRLDYSTIYHERGIKTVANATRQDGLEFFQYIQQHPLDVEVHQYDLKDALQAHIDLKGSDLSGSAVLVL